MNSSVLKGLVIALALCTHALCFGAEKQAHPKPKVITTFTDRNTTKLVIESHEPLVSGRNAHVGPRRIPVTVGALLSRSEFLYYFSASTPGKVDIPNGAEVDLTAPQSLKSPAAAKLRLTLEENYTFEQKRQGEVTAVQNDRAMIDRGTLHEVRERDLYRVYDSSGRYKGMLEIAGIGDLQSSGQLYNSLEDLHRTSLQTQPGDRVVFAGQRKLFALGLVGGVRIPSERVVSKPETTYGAGLLWNITFRDGWGFEVLFGGYSRDVKGRTEVRSPTLQLLDAEQSHREARFIAPVWMKKSFFYPNVVSPFLGAGLSMFVGRHQYSRFVQGSVDVEEEKSVTTVAPVLGGGLELFPGRFFRPRIEARYFHGPNITAAGNTFRTGSWFYSLGFLTTW